MVPHWEHIERALRILQPKVIVEVGAAGGRTTARLAQFATDAGGELHSIDPKPRFDTDEYTQKWPALRIHRGLSLEVLPTMEKIDAATLDGDHNWYTVTRELELLAKHDPYPVTFLHDVGWPYGRRDMYYAPDQIPEEARHPHVKGGMLPGRSSAVPNRDVNPGVFNAVEEGGEKNGVLTAIEDFLGATDLPLGYREIPGFAGLGIVYDRRTTEAKPELGALIDEFGSGEFLARQCTEIDLALNRSRASLTNARRRLRALEGTGKQATSKKAAKKAKILAAKEKQASLQGAQSQEST